MKSAQLKNNKGGFFDGPLILYPNIYKDQRGAFFESWNMQIFGQLINKNINFVQDNQSISQKGVLRGLHFQTPPMEQGKLVRCTSGAVFDVIVDLRLRSKTFSLWGGILLDSANNNQLWIPPGFAHGFLTLESDTIFEYKVTNYWSKENERSLLWDDSTISVNWPEINGKIIISPKDAKANAFEILKTNNDFFK